MNKLIRVSLGSELALVRLLDEIFIALFVGEPDGILFGLEAQMSALHEVATALPAHQRVFPPVAFRQDIPVHPPMVRFPVSGLTRGFGRFVNTSYGLC